MLPLSFSLTGFQLFLAAITVLFWLIATLACWPQLCRTPRRAVFAVFYAGTFLAVLGVFLAADFLTAFLFFELMSVLSWVLVLHTQTSRAMAAADTYLAVAIIGGMATLLGVLLLYHEIGTLRFDAVAPAVAALEAPGRAYVAGVLIFVGFGAKAGLFPMHIWLPITYPAAPAPATTVFSSVISKCGVFGVALVTTRIFAGVQAWGLLLLALSCVSMVLGALLALLSTDLKRTFACSSLSQVGFICVGISMLGLLGPAHNALAAQGTVLHLLNHATIKGLLFPCAAVVFYGAGSYEYDKIRGYGRGKPLLAVMMGLPMFSLAGIPGLSGYVSKTLLHESMVEYLHAVEGSTLAGWISVAEWAFLFAGGLTLAYMLKVFVCLFVQKPVHPFPPERDIPVSSWLPVLVLSLALPVLGLTPGITLAPLSAWAMDLLSAAHAHLDLAWFSSVNLRGAAVSILIGIAVYLLLVRTVLVCGDRYPDRWPKKLDLENLFYRPLLLGLLPFLGTLVARAADALTEATQFALRSLVFAGARRTVCPREDDHFTVYSASRARKLGPKHTLAYSMAWACGGIIVLGIYLMYVYFTN